MRGQHLEGDCRIPDGLSRSPHGECGGDGEKWTMRYILQVEAELVEDVG